MDSERRHELESNDLREFLDNFKDFWDRHGNKILFGLILVLGSFTAYTQYNQWKARSANEAQEQLAGAITADQLVAVADEYPQVHDEAMRRAGDLYFAQARNESIDGDSADKALKQAGSAFTALADRGASTEYQLIGHEGLAKVAIMNAEWDQAKTHYDNMIELAGDTFLAHAQRAQAGLDRLDLLRNPVAFAPDDDLLFTPDDEGPAIAPEDDAGPVDPVDPILPESLAPGNGSPSE